jgi:hypothetical protein
MGTVVEQGGDTRGVIMPERQRPNWLRWLLEVPQFGGRIAGLALENDHAAESRREPRRAVHVVETVDAPTAVGSWCSSISWMSRAMTSCPMAEPTLSSQMPGAKSFTESAMIVPTFGQISSAKSAN